ncbi:hypothetical protein Trydic_g23268 [Trypoxylus dichotomus]
MSEVILEQDEARVLKTLTIGEDKLNHYMDLFLQWIASQRYLPQNFNASCRKKFLLWAKLDFEKAKKKFKNFCYNPWTYKEFYSDRILTFEHDIKASLEMIYEIPMPKLTPNGYRVTVAKFRNADNLNILTLARFLTIYLDYRLHKDTIVAGEIVIIDLECMKPHHYAKLFNPTYLKIVKFFVLSCPFMLKNIFAVNCHPLLEKGITLVRSVLPQKLAERIMTLANPKDLYQHIPPECLPSEYDGHDKSIEHFQDLLRKFWMSQKGFFEELDRCKPTGPIPEEFKYHEDEFGVDGSFRKLNLD